jgi:hypothetical protein
MYRNSKSQYVCHDAGNLGICTPVITISMANVSIVNPNMYVMMLVTLEFAPLFSQR